MNNIPFRPVNFIKIQILILLVISEILSFGKNKVQFSQLNWWKIQSDHYNLYYHQDVSSLPQIADNWINNAYKSLSKELSFSHTQPIPIIIYGNPTLFAQTNIITEILPEGVGGFTELFKTRIAVPFTGSYKEFRHVIHHEMVHAFVFGIVYDKFGAGSAMFNNAQIPFWFNEGAAEYLSSGWDCEADMFMMEQALNSSIPLPGPYLDGYMAYKGGQSFLHYLHTSKGDSAFSKFLLEFKKTKMVDNSIRKIYKQTTEELGKEWIKELRRIYWPEIGQREDPSNNSTFITSHRETKDQYNLRPRISPDGQKIAFFSDRKDYTHILITDRKGKLIHDVSQNGYGGFFESFHPFRSGMCWSPDGNRLAFVTLSRGKDEIRIIDIKKKRLIKKIRLPLTSISSPDWSRDGKWLVFSAISKGFGDLYMYNLDSDSLSRITESVQYEADPRFSPDGKKIVFSLEDTTGIPDHPKSPYGSSPSDIASIDLSTKKLQKITSTIWNEKHPCYSSDGKHFIYVSDRNGIDNIYIQSLDSSAQSKPLTDFIGGCSNPDWAYQDSCIVFSLFQNQGWDILLIDKPLQKITKDSLTNTVWVKSHSDTSSVFYKRSAIKNDSIAELKEPSRKKKLKVSGINDSVQNNKINNIIQADTSDTTIKTDSIPEKKDISLPVDLPDNPKATDTSETTKAEFSPLIRNSITDSSNTISADSSNKSVPLKVKKPVPYRLKFTPDMVAFGLGISNYYSPAGQLLLSFSDLMGDHQIITAADIQGNFKDYMHFFASYIYLRNRLDIGVGAFYNKDYSYADIFGERLYHDQESGAFLFLRYPLSIFTRFDFELFFRDIQRESLQDNDPDIKSTSLLQSLSFTFDNILWGITGPLNGIRITSTAQLSPPLDFVDEHFVSFDADIRTYLHMFKKFVWANRAFLGISKSLDNGSSARRYLLGGNENWFSYSINREQYDKNLQYSFYSDFVTPFRGFDYMDLSGSRVAVFNSEFRFPFIREISMVWPLPIQIRYITGAIFTDIGNAWNAGENYHDFPLPDKVYGGFGFGLRANLGMFILRYDRGWPTDWRHDVGTPKNYFSLGAEF